MMIINLNYELYIIFDHKSEKKIRIFFIYLRN